jgi:alcohol dehydrogenase
VRAKDRPALEVADIVRAHGEAFVRTHVLLPEQHAVLRAIQRCRTAELGAHADVCDACGHVEVAYDSCRDRHCPKCQSLAQARWVARRMQRVLPTHAFHVVFTLPSELRGVALQNRDKIFNLLFASAAEALLELGRDPKWLGAELGITSVLHAVVKVLRTTICGSDLHILKGDVPECKDGLVLGHEGVGIVEEVGATVSNFKKGDHVIISCITSCGRCDACKRGMYSHCADGGWILGHVIDGTQAEYVRIPHADSSLHRVPVGADEDALVMLSDILPTGFECGVLNGAVKPGDTIALVGAGPVGLAALMTAQFFSPAESIMLDIDDNRLEVSRTFGATRVVNSADGKGVERVMALTANKGVDVAIEAVGTPLTFDICQEVVAPGGHLANIGVHGKGVELKMGRLWSHNITLTTRLVDTVTLPMLLKTVLSGKLQPRKLITHEFGLSELVKAYDVFGNAAKEKALKVLLKGG